VAEAPAPDTLLHVAGRADKRPKGPERRDWQSDLIGGRAEVTETDIPVTICGDPVAAEPPDCSEPVRDSGRWLGKPAKAPAPDTLLIPPKQRSASALVRASSPKRACRARDRLTESLEGRSVTRRGTSINTSSRAAAPRPLISRRCQSPLRGSGPHCRKLGRTFHRLNADAPPSRRGYARCRVEPAAGAFHATGATDAKTRRSSR
jgi:hypothetical protein